MAKPESLPYSERSILVLGGAGVNSIGRAAVDRFYQLGTPDIYIGTTKEANFGLVVRDYKKKGLSTDNLHPFVASVTDKMALAGATRRIKQNGHKLTDVIFSHAGGMEGYMQKLIDEFLGPIRSITQGKSMYTLDQARQEEVLGKMAVMREKIVIWREEAIPHGIAVNFDGTFNAIDVLGEEFTAGFRGVFINSTWGRISGSPGAEIPLLYGPVDISKAMVHRRLEQEGQFFQEQGVEIDELIASLVRRTRVGKMFQDYLLPISRPAQAAVIKNTAVDPQDVVLGICILIEGGPYTKQQYPRELFVTGADGKAIYRDHLEPSPMYTMPYPY